MKIGKYDLGIGKPVKPKKRKHPEILKVETDESGKITKVYLAGGESFTFNEFIDLFKQELRTVIAGEVVSWDDYWRYQKQISPKAMEVHLDVVEAEARTSALKIPKLTRGQAIAVGTIILLFFVAMIGLMFARTAGLL